VKESSVRFPLTWTLLQQYTFLDILENYAIPQLNNSNNFVLELGTATVRFAHIIRD
jgi:hypothetical protein